MTIKFIPVCVLLCLLLPSLQGQTFSVSGKVLNSTNGEELVGASVVIAKESLGTISNENGRFEFNKLKNGSYEITASYLGYESITKEITVDNSDVVLEFKMESLALNLNEITVEAKEEKTFGISRLKAVEGVAIYAAKKNEVVVLKDITANLATNNSR